MRNPDFSQLLKVLDRKKPDRPVLFEFFLNAPLYKKLAGPEYANLNDSYFEENQVNPVVAKAFYKAGYDYVTTRGSNILFKAKERHHKESVSLNEGFVITDRESFRKYEWPEPDQLDYSGLEEGKKFLADGMKFIACGPGGVLENVIQLTGYENLCMMLVDNPKLAADIFASVGERLVRHYEIVCKYDSVGACISNDDWGFKTQTMLSPADMRKYVILWHRKIAKVIHEANRPVILHSCGMLEEVMDDIVDDIGYDGKHSYEDAICPVEEMYERYSDRIAIMGGIDLDFVCRSSCDEIRERSMSMLERAKAKNGAFALGTGNSVPSYVPDENYFAMIDCVRSM